MFGTTVFFLKLNLLAWKNYFLYSRKSPTSVVFESLFHSNSIESLKHDTNQEKNKKNNSAYVLMMQNLGSAWVVPPPSKSHHQDCYIFSI